MVRGHVQYRQIKVPLAIARGTFIWRLYQPYQLLGISLHFLQCINHIIDPCFAGAEG